MSPPGRVPFPAASPAPVQGSSAPSSRWPAWTEPDVSVALLHLRSVGLTDAQAYRLLDSYHARGTVRRLVGFVQNSPDELLLEDARRVDESGRKFSTWPGRKSYGGGYERDVVRWDPRDDTSTAHPERDRRTS
jgi:hypothetical protein